MGFNEGMSTNWEDDWSDNKLIYGGPKVGKTTIAALLLKRNLDNDPKARAFVVNTDKGFAIPAKFIGLGDPAYDGKITYYFVNTIKRAIEVMNEVRRTVEERNNPNDTILFDLLSWSWDEAQKEFVSELSDGDVVGYIARAMKDPKKFGQFEGLQWGYIKKVEDMVSNYLTKNPICKVIALARVKDVSMTYKLSGLKKDLWYTIGKPDSRKDIMYEFATVIKVEKYKEDDEIKRKFMVVAARGGDPDYKWYAYDTPDNFCDQIEKLSGGLTPKSPPLVEVETPPDEEIMKDLVVCIKENFADMDTFCLEDVIEICGHEDLVTELLKQALDAGKLFYNKEADYFTFQKPKEEKKAKPKKEPKPKKEKKPDPVKEPTIAENELDTLQAVIFMNQDEEGFADISFVMKECVNMPLFPDNETTDIAISILLDKGELFSPEIGKVSVINKEYVEDIVKKEFPEFYEKEEKPVEPEGEPPAEGGVVKSKELATVEPHVLKGKEPVKEESQPKDDDDGWL